MLNLSVQKNQDRSDCMKFALYQTIPKMVKARQLQQVQQFVDEKTGEKFIGQIGDWQVSDQDGYIYLMGYYEFIDRYYPVNQKAFDQFAKKEQIYGSRGQIFNKMKCDIRQWCQDIKK